MYLITTTIIIGFFFALYCLYMFGKDDLILMRKDVALEEVFNIAFSSLVVGILLARLIYAVFHPAWGYLNPFVFFLFPYFPGLSLAGGIGGASLFIYLYTKKKKLPIEHVFDIFSLSFLFGLSMGSLFSFLVALFTKKHILFTSWIQLGVCLTLFIILVPFFWHGKMKHGLISLYSMGSLFLLLFITDIFQKTHKEFFVFFREDILYFFYVFIVIILIEIKLGVFNNK